MGTLEQGPWPYEQGPQQRAQRIEEFRPFSPAQWMGSTPPAYDWMVDGCFLTGTVALLSGDGGLGKSLILQQLCTAAAIGGDWLGLRTKRCKTFFMGCEDDSDELHRRQAAICEHYGADMGDLEDMLLIERAGKENSLVDFDRRTDQGRSTELYTQLSTAVRAHGAQLVVLDTVADVFSGNEIIRNQVRRFVTVMRKLAIEIQGTVILTAHPSNEGMASGSGLSGSRAWNNSVRSRIYLTRDGKDESGDRNVRWLKTMKANYGPSGGKLKLRWSRGVFGLDDAPPVRNWSEPDFDAAM